MLPESIPHYSIGPFFGLATNVVMALLCLVTFILYRHYRPEKSFRTESNPYRGGFALSQIRHFPYTLL